MHVHVAVGPTCRMAFISLSPLDPPHEHVMPLLSTCFVTGACRRSTRLFPPHELTTASLLLLRYMSLLLQGHLISSDLLKDPPQGGEIEFSIPIAELLHAPCEGGVNESTTSRFPLASHRWNRRPWIHVVLDRDGEIERK